ncbi:VTT domain-containing protein [candidate division TA06 bacterium]|nr:VTT domain-containing protein [candidate division TA06 bacterium]
MNYEDLITKFGVYLSTFLVCLVSGFVPVVNAEVYLVLISAFVPISLVPPLIFLSTLGQMTAKSILFYAGRGVLNLPLRRYEKKIDRVREKFEKWKPRTDLFILLSASTGFPPFYIVSVLAGVMKMSFVRFFIFGFTGRFLRFSVTLLLPQLVKGFIQ